MDLLNPGIGLLFWTLIAFIIVFVILKKFAWKPILSSLKEREHGIASAIASADKLRAEMEHLKGENEALLQQAREERAIMIKEAKDTADRMIADAQNKGKAEYERILADAQASITQQKNAALTDVKNQVGNLVIEVAEKVLRKQLENKPAQEAYIKQLADAVKLN